MYTSVPCPCTYVINYNAMFIVCIAKNSSRRLIDSCYCFNCIIKLFPTSPGYVEAKVIPSGARNIRVEEVAEANNFLAVKNGKGHYFFNGHWVIQWSGDYKAAGTIIHYERNGNLESFTSTGPLKEPLHIMVRRRYPIEGYSYGAIPVLHNVRWGCQIFRKKALRTCTIISVTR